MMIVEAVLFDQWLDAARYCDALYEACCLTPQNRVGFETNQVCQDWGKHKEKQNGVSRLYFAAGVLPSL